MSKITKVDITESPSYQFNNLSYSIENDSVVYVHHNEVILHSLCGRGKKKISMSSTSTSSTSASSSSSSSCQICSASFVSMGSDDLLIITSSNGIQIWTSNGSTTSILKC